MCNEFTNHRRGWQRKGRVDDRVRRPVQRTMSVATLKNFYLGTLGHCRPFAPSRRLQSSLCHVEAPPRRTTAMCISLTGNGVYKRLAVNCYHNACNVAECVVRHALERGFACLISTHCEGFSLGVCECSKFRIAFAIRFAPLLLELFEVGS